MKGSLTKYLHKRWSPRVGQMFALHTGDVIYEGRRVDFVHDDSLPFVFKNKDQVKFIQAFITNTLSLREEYNVPVPGKEYFLFNGHKMISMSNFGKSIFDWYLYENGFILSQEVPTEKLQYHGEIIKNYLKVIEDVYIDEYWHMRMSNPNSIS